MKNVIITSFIHNFDYCDNINPFAAEARIL